MPHSAKTIHILIIKPVLARPIPAGTLFMTRYARYAPAPLVSDRVEAVLTFGPVAVPLADIFDPAVRVAHQHRVLPALGRFVLVDEVQLGLHLLLALAPGSFGIDGTTGRSGLIANTTTQAGLKIRAGLGQGQCPTGIKITDAKPALPNLKPDNFHGQWNYTVLLAQKKA